MSEEREENFDNSELCWMREQPFLLKYNTDARIFKQKLVQNRIQSVLECVKNLKSERSLSLTAK